MPQRRSSFLHQALFVAFLHACTQGGSGANPGLELERERIASLQNAAPAAAAAAPSFKFIRNDGSEVSGQVLLKQGEQFSLEAAEAKGANTPLFHLRQSTIAESERAFGDSPAVATVGKSASSPAELDPQHDDTPEASLSLQHHDDSAAHRGEMETEEYRLEVEQMDRYDMAKICASPDQRKRQCRIPADMPPGPYTMLMGFHNSAGNEDEIIEVILIVPAEASHAEETPAEVPAEEGL